MRDVAVTIKIRTLSKSAISSTEKLGGFLCRRMDFILKMNEHYSLTFKKKYYNSDLENQVVFRQTGSVFLLCRAVSPVFVEWNNAMYHHAHSLQGDAVGLLT